MPLIRYRRPSPLLRPFVQFFTQREMKLNDPVFIHPVPARAAPMLEFIYGDRFQVFYRDRGREDTTPRVVMVGLQTRPFAQLKLQGSLLSFVIMFQPTGLDRLFRVPVGELTNHDFDARSVLGRELDELDHRLGDCDTLEERAAAAERFLLLRVVQAGRVDRIRAAAHRVLAADGCVRVSDIAAWAGLGVRQCEREFERSFGMGPKLFARIVRFQAALDRKARSNSKTWTEVAQEFGYFDQMHMIHDFEQFAAEKPTEMLGVVESLFREQIEAMRLGLGVRAVGMVPRFMV
ncbi:MAG: helix-turn-helix domain-containing protein [Terracidiphilus sp.]